jgi:hypothetical protein
VEEDTQGDAKCEAAEKDLLAADERGFRTAILQVLNLRSSAFIRG